SPPARHAWTAVARGRSVDRTYVRKAGQTTYAARNTASGAVAPIRTGMGGVPGRLTSAPEAPSRKIHTNQRASTPKMIGLTATPRWGGAVCEARTPGSADEPVPGPATPGGARAVTRAPAGSLALCNHSRETLAEGK